MFILHINTMATIRSRQSNQLRALVLIRSKCIEIIDPNGGLFFMVRNSKIILNIEKLLGFSAHDWTGAAIFAIFALDWTENFYVKRLKVHGKKGKRLWLSGRGFKFSTKIVTFLCGFIYTFGWKKKYSEWHRLWHIVMNSDELVRRVGLRSETFSRVLLLKIPFDLGNNRTKVVKREVSYPVMKTD